MVSDELRRHAGSFIELGGHISKGNKTTKMPGCWGYLLNLLPHVREYEKVIRIIVAACRLVDNVLRGR